MANQRCDLVGRSVRTLLDLPRYEVLAVERWPGWSRLVLAPKALRFRCPRCRATVAEGRASRWRPLRDLDISRRHIELLVRVYHEVDPDLRTKKSRRVSRSHDIAEFRPKMAPICTDCKTFLEDPLFPSSGSQEPGSGDVSVFEIARALGYRFLWTTRMTEKLGQPGVASYSD